MVKLDLYWKSNRAWYHYNDALIPVLNEDAPPEAKESYQNYCKQKKAIDRQTKRTLVIPKSEAGVQLYEKEDPDWSRGSYETEKWRIFVIPYEEFRILRERIDITGYMEEARYKLSGGGLQEFIALVEKECQNVPQTLAVLKEAVGYNTFIEYVEENII